MQRRQLKRDELLLFNRRQKLKAHSRRRNNVTGGVTNHFGVDIEKDAFVRETKLKMPVCIMSLAIVMKI